MKHRQRNAAGRMHARPGLTALIMSLILFLPACGATSAAVSTPTPDTASAQTANPSSGTAEAPTVTKESSTQATASYQVPTITCPSCVARVKANARKDPGVLDTQVRAQHVTVAYDPAKTDPEKIAEAIRSGGDTVLPDA